MHPSELVKIKVAIGQWEALQGMIEYCDRQVKSLASHKEEMFIGFSCNSGNVSIPAKMQENIRSALRAEFARLTRECLVEQSRIVCEAGTAAKVETEFWPEDSGDCS